jgi:phosphomethylpyrimidine synthase
MCGPKFCSMKITQEVRAFAASAATSDRPGDGQALEREAKRSAAEFARLNPSPSAEAEKSPLPVAGEGGAASAAEGEGASSQTAAPSPEDAEQGMAAMSRRFEESGGEIYVPTED